MTDIKPENITGEDLDKAAYTYAITREFGRVVVNTGIAANIAITAAGVAINRDLGVAVIGAQIVWQFTVNTNAAFSALMSEGRDGFLARHWPQIRDEWPQPLDHMRFFTASGKWPETAAPSMTGFPERLRADLRRAAIETGIRTTLLRPVYDAGKAVLARLPRKPQP